jgi:DNA-binding response OmpR family regulator
LPRILHVEDDEDLISVIGATLTRKAEMVAARSLQHAEQLLRDDGFGFDLVLLDQVLPDGDGLGLVPGLLKSRVPIVLLVNEVPANVSPNVAAVLVKSQQPAAQAAAAILTYLARAPTRT